MKLTHHIKIAKIVRDNLKDIKGQEQFVMYKVPYYLGSILPDLNCVYPAHRLSTTEKRFIKYINKVDNINDGIMKSIYLGILTHYVCDYFCYAHANESLGLPHKKYETGLYKLFNKHEQLFKTSENTVVSWKEAMKVIQEKVLDSTDTMTMQMHAEMILEQIKILNKEYMEKSNGFRKDKSWVVDTDQMCRDLEQAEFICENIMLLILDPFRLVLKDMDVQTIKA